MLRSDVAARNHGSQRRHRGGIELPPAKPMSSGFAAEHCCLCRSEKHEVFGCRAVGGGDGSERITSGKMMIPCCHAHPD